MRQSWPRQERRRDPEERQERRPRRPGGQLRRRRRVQLQRRREPALQHHAATFPPNTRYLDHNAHLRTNPSNVIFQNTNFFFVSLLHYAGRALTQDATLARAAIARYYLVLGPPRRARHCDGAPGGGASSPLPPTTPQINSPPPSYHRFISPTVHRARC